jgi:hypothetical protein
MYRGQRPEAIDTRWVFRAYAALASLAGFLLLGWGPMWFGVDLAGEPFGKAALIRVLGSMMIAAGCCAAGFALAMLGGDLLVTVLPPRSGAFRLFIPLPRLAPWAMFFRPPGLGLVTK